MERTLPGVRVPNLWSIVAATLLLSWSAWILLHMQWSLSDMPAYDHAAQRLLSGQPLYPPLADPTASDVYRYAPWFALAWTPMLALPIELRGVVWSLILVGASVLAAWPLLSSRRLLPVALGVFSATWLIGAAKWGNVEPLMIALLVWGVPRRCGPVAVGIAASLKGVPILLALVWIGRGEWRKAALAVLVAGILLAPMLLFDLSHYPIEATAVLSVRRAFGDVAWIALTAALSVATLLVSRTRWAWLTADVAALSAYPQLPLYRLGMLLVGLDRAPVEADPIEHRLHAPRRRFRAHTQTN